MAQCSLHWPLYSAADDLTFRPWSGGESLPDASTFAQRNNKLPVNQVPITLERARKQSELLNLTLNPQERYMVSWYGAVLSNNRDNWVRRLAVWFRHLDDNNVLGDYERCDVALTSLGQLRIGSVWQAGQSREQSEMCRREFHVTFSEADWERAASYASMPKEEGPPLLDLDVYRLPFAKDRSMVLRFSHAEGTLLVPCIEFLRCYGRSQDINKILTRFTWEEVTRRLHLDHDVEVKPGYQVISLPPGLGQEEAHLLAHLRYNWFTNRKVREINSYIDKDLIRPGSGFHSFPVIGPWFEGPGQLEVEGVQIDARTFLGLRITGYTVPSTPAIWSVRSGFPMDADEKLIDGRFPVPRIRKIGEDEVTPVADDLLADRGSEIIQISDPSIRLLGTPAQVITQSRTGKIERGTPGVVPDKTEVSAPGDTYGKGKGVGQADFTSSFEIEPQGAVLDIWNGLQYLRQRYPERIRSLSCFTTQGMVSAAVGDTPKLARLAVPFNATPSLRKWLYVESATPRRARGVLVVEIITDEGRGYLFEVERKAKGGQADEPYESTEESFSGLAVTAPPHRALHEWVPMVLAQISRSRGIMATVLASLPWLRGRDYRRPARSAATVAGQSVAENAFRKLGFRPLR